MSTEVQRAAAFSAEDVQTFAEDTWKGLHASGRFLEVIRVTELDIPDVTLWRVDAVEKLGQTYHTYALIVYISAQQTLKLAFSKGEHTCRM